MYYLCTGNELLDCGDASTDGLTPLEKALDALFSLEPLCTDRVAQLAGTVASLIKQQVLWADCVIVNNVRDLDSTS